MEQQDYKQAVDRIVVDEQLRSKVHDQVFKSVNNKKNFNKYVSKHRKIAAAAVIILLVGIPGSVIGARGVWQQHMDVSVENVGQYAMNYTFETVTDSKGDSDSTSLIHVPVKVQYGYIPEGYVSDGGIKFSLNGKGVQGFSVIVYSVDSDNPLQFQGVSKVTDTEINGHKAVIQERVTAWNSLLIFYDEYGYAVQIFYKDVSEDDLMKFGSGLELVKCDAGEGFKITDAKYSTPQHITAESKAPITCDGSKFSSVGDEVKGVYFDSMSKDLRFTVENVEILDSINGLDRNKFCNNDHITMYFGEDGSILDKSVQQIIRGDGINTVDTVGDTFTYKQKLVYLTVKCVNKGNNLLEKMTIKPRIALTNQQDGKYSLGTTVYDAYCDRDYTPDSIKNNDNYFTVQPNEEFEYHIAYLLTEEELSRTILTDFSIGAANLAKDESSFVRIIN